MHRSAIPLFVWMSFFLFFGSYSQISNATIRPPTKYQLLVGEYAAVERYIERRESEYFEGRAGDHIVDIAYRPFYGSSPDLKERIDEWMQEFPNSHRPYVARARYFQQLGWLARGNDSSSKTSSDQMMLMRRYHDKAISDLNSALDIKPNHTVAYADLIDLAKANKGPQFAWELAKKGLENDNASYAIYRSLLFTLQPKWGGSLLDMRAAIEDAEKHIDKNQRLSSLRGYMSYVKADRIKRSDDFERAISVYTDAIEHGEIEVFLVGRAYAHWGMGDFKAAERDVLRGLERSPDDYILLRLMGKLKNAQNNYEDALIYFDRAIASNSLDLGSRIGRAIANINLENWEEVVEDYEKAAIFGVDDERYYFNSAVIEYQYLNDFEAAKGYAERAYEVAPDVLENLSILLSTEIYTDDCDAKERMREYSERCKESAECGETDIFRFDSLMRERNLASKCGG